MSDDELKQPSGDDSSDSEDSDEDSNSMAESKIVGGRQTVTVFKKIAGKKGIGLTATINGKPYTNGSNVIIDIEIKNDSNKEIKEIGVKLETTKVLTAKKKSCSSSNRYHATIFPRC